jgi:hypothetical protein
MKKFIVQMWYRKSQEWVDDTKFETITEAVNYFQEYTTEYPDTQYRILQILEV